MTPAPVSQDPAAQAGSQDQDEAQGTPLAVIEVTVAQDGSITVESETGAQEGQEESGAGEESGGAQPTPVKDSTEAASLVKQMIDSATQTTEQQTAQNKSEQAAGYAGQ